MKSSFPVWPLLAAGLLVLATAPRALAQLDETLVHTPAGQHPAASPAEESDVFDALKKGITKVQKQAKAAKEVEPQLQALKKQQDAMQQELTEGKERLHTVLLHQAEEIKSLQGTVARLDAELKALKPAAPTPGPSPAN